MSREHVVRLAMDQIFHLRLQGSHRSNPFERQPMGFP